MGQFPLRWTDNLFATVNALMDGSETAVRDQRTATIVWQLSFKGLSDGERKALETFFDETRGSRHSFTMLDPSDNLIAWSEDFTQACWQPGPLLNIIPGIRDPIGGTAAARLTNTGQATQGVLQQMNGPGGYRYCFSVYVRSETPKTVTLVQACNATTLQQSVSTSENWERVMLSGMVAPGDGVSFGIELAPGVQVEIFGAQVEAQPAAGTYKRTTVSGGVYQNCRFDQDELEMTATAPGAYGCALRIRTVGRLPWAA